MAKPRSGHTTATIDAHVAARLRQCRITLGLTQRQLSNVIGVSYRQMHKYERGLNRVPASSLYGIARALHLPIGYFYDGLGRGARRPADPDRATLAEVTRDFSAIRNQKHQDAFSQLVRILAGQ